MSTDRHLVLQVEDVDLGRDHRDRRRWRLPPVGSFVTDEAAWHVFGAEGFRYARQCGLEPFHVPMAINMTVKSCPTEPAHPSELPSELLVDAITFQRSHWRRPDGSRFELWRRIA